MVSGRLFGLFTREFSSRVDNSTLGAGRPRRGSTDTADVRSALMNGDISGAPKGFGDLGKMAIYFQGSREHW